MDLGTQEQRTEGMKRQAQDLIDQAYQRGFKAGYEQGFKNEFDEGASHPNINIIEEWIEQGRNEAWETIIKIVEMPWPERRKTLERCECLTLFDLFSSIPASEAIEKIKAYEEKKQEQDEIKVGDEIRVGKEYRNAFNVVVHLVGERCDGVKVYQCISSRGTHYTCTIEDVVRKTGRHFPQIAEILAKMEEGE